MSKELKKKIARTSSHAMFPQSRFTKIDLSCGMCKKIKFGTKNKKIHKINLSYIDNTRKYLFSTKTLQTYIDYGEVRAKFVDVFLQFEMYIYFLVEEHMHPGDELSFP
jgi:hypothetical protein